MINNTLTPETYNVDAAYRIVMEDNGHTYIGDFAKAWNKQAGALLMELTIYATNKQLPNPTLVARLEKSKSGSRSSNIIKKSPNGSITISQTRLQGTPLENISEISMHVDNETGRIYLSRNTSDVVPANSVSGMENTSVSNSSVEIEVDEQLPAAVQ